MPNRAWEFENFLRFEMPWMLNLSPSKQLATEIQFNHLADFVDSLIKKSPKEFDFFFKEFQKNLIRISKWRAPTHKNHSYRRASIGLLREAFRAG